MTDTSSGTGAKGSQGYGRAVGGLVIVGVLIAFILSNRNTTQVSFLFISVDDVPLWVTLTIAAALGVAAGFVLGRRRYRGRSST